MKKKKILWIILLLFLMFCSCAGQYMEVVESYNKVLVLGAIDTIIITGIMIIVPVIYRIKNKSKLDLIKGKKICKWNSIIIFVLSIILSVVLLNGNSFIGVGGVGAFIFYFINKWIFVEEKNEKESEVFKFIILLFVIIIVVTMGFVLFISLSNTNESNLKETGKSYTLTEDGLLVESGKSYTLIEE